MGIYTFGMMQCSTGSRVHEISSRQDGKSNLSRYFLSLTEPNLLLFLLANWAIWCYFTIFLMFKTTYKYKACKILLCSWHTPKFWYYEYLFSRCFLLSQWYGHHHAILVSLHRLQTLGPVSYKSTNIKFTVTGGVSFISANLFMGDCVTITYHEQKKKSVIRNDGSDHKF